MSADTRDALQKEIDQNFEEFKRLLPQLEDQQGKYVLMRQKKIINIYDTFQDAYSTGKTMYEDGLFSVQKITSAPIDLGFLSHAVHIQ